MNKISFHYNGGTEEHRSGMDVVNIKIIIDLNNWNVTLKIRLTDEFQNAVHS